MLISTLLQYIDYQVFTKYNFSIVNRTKRALHDSGLSGKEEPC